jgi:hypothetical protein
VFGASCRSLLRFCSGFRSLPAPNVTFRPGIVIHQPLRNPATTARPGNSPGSFGRQERAGGGRHLFCSAQRSLRACLSHVHAESIPRLHREVHDRPHRLPRRQLKFEIPRQRRQNQITSRTAKVAPRHIRGPTPNGGKAKRSIVLAAPGRKREGSNTSGSRHNKRYRCSA